MSADNCVCLLKTIDWFKFENESSSTNCLPNGITAYRVAHIQGFDSYQYIKETELHNLGVWMKNNFGKSKIFYNEDEAMNFAIELHKSVGWTEHGILGLDASEYNFPGY